MGGGDGIGREQFGDPERSALVTLAVVKPVISLVLRGKIGSQMM
jgi:hypothetical protein